MGYHTLIAVSHDLFDEQAWAKALQPLRTYIGSGDANEARDFEQATRGCAKVIALRDSSTPYYVSNVTPGFPTQLPFDEQLDVENQRWEEALKSAKALLGGALKTRKVGELRNLIAEMAGRVFRSNGLVQLLDGTINYGQRKLANDDWVPKRSDYAALLTELENIREEAKI